MNETAVAKPDLKNIELQRGVLPKDYEDVMRFAGLVHSSGLAPKGFDTAPKVAVGILTNLELRRPIITGLQGLAIINGRCGIYGNDALAMVTASGLMENGYPKETETGTPFEDDWTFTFTVKRKGHPENTGIWTWAESKRAGFDEPKTREGKPDIWSPWTRFTRRMMQWKARTFVLRDEFGDVLRGMNTVEELHDIIDLEQTTAETFQKPALPPEAVNPETGEIKNLYETKESPAELKPLQPAGGEDDSATAGAEDDEAAKLAEIATELFDELRGQRKLFGPNVRGRIEVILNHMTEFQRQEVKRKWRESAVKGVNGVKKDEPFPGDVAAASPPPPEEDPEETPEDKGAASPSGETESTTGSSPSTNGQNGFTYCPKKDGAKVPEAVCEDCPDQLKCAEEKYWQGEIAFFNKKLGPIIVNHIIREKCGDSDHKKVPVDQRQDVLIALNAALDDMNNQKSQDATRD